MTALTVHKGGQLKPADAIAWAEAAFSVDPTALPWTKEAFNALAVMADPPGYSFARYTERARQALAVAPEKAEVISYRERVKEAVEAAPDPNATLALVGMLIEAFPSSKATSAFMNTLAHDLVSMSYGPHVVARACQTLRRKSKFLPSISETLDACADALRQLKSGLHLAERVEARMTDALAILKQSEGEG